MAIAIPDISPSELLARMRGPIIRANPAYPEVIQMRIRDSKGEVWRFSTSYAEFSPSDPDFFLGKIVADIEFDVSGRLKMLFEDDSEFNVFPEPEGPDDDLSAWNLITPDGLSLRFRPRGLWTLRSADEVV